MMTPVQRKMARHALGLPNGNQCSYRNYYAAGRGSHAETVWNELVAVGLAERGTGGPQLIGFVLTEKGARAALEDGETLDREDFPKAA